MRLDQSQFLSQEMRQTLSPQMIQAMEILQLPMLALQERIDQEMETNPVLELGASNEEPVEPYEDYEDRSGERDLVVGEQGGNSEDFERLDNMTDELGEDFTNSDFSAEYTPGPYRGDAEAGNRKLEAMANAPAPEESLGEYLLEQWRFFDLPSELRDAGERIIDYIEEDGYLRVPLDELAGKTDSPTPRDVLDRALTWVQSLEPTGVGARSLRECLLLQLRANEQAGEDVTLEKQLVGDFLREIEMNRLPAIAKRLNRDIEDVKRGIERISRLDPKPGLQIGEQAAPILQPDVLVDLTDHGEVVVRMADENTPQLSINEYYSEIARDRATERDARKFLQKNIRSAHWLIGAIAQRRRTVRRVAEEVFAVQREFLEHGREALKPLPMADVAEKVGVHVATVSRAVAEKYVQTPQGIHPLRMFFSGGTTTADGEDMSWDAVKAKLRDVVDHEDKSKPLSDEALAKAMQAEGIQIARRTVAKYRDLLGIPPARKRKEY